MLLTAHVRAIALFLTAATMAIALAIGSNAEPTAVTSAQHPSTASMQASGANSLFLGGLPIDQVEKPDCLPKDGAEVLTGYPIDERSVVVMALGGIACCHYSRMQLS